MNTDEGRLKAAVNELFASHRDATQAECMAYIASPEGAARGWIAPYVAFRNGVAAEGGEPWPRWKLSAKSVDEMITDTKAAIVRAFPECAAQEVVWRRDPEIIEQSTEHPPLCYVRIVAIPPSN